MLKYPDKMNGFKIDNREKKGTLFECLKMCFVKKKNTNRFECVVEHK